MRIVKLDISLVSGDLSIPYPVYLWPKNPAIPLIYLNRTKPTHPLLSQYSSIKRGRGGALISGEARIYNFGR